MTPHILVVEDDSAMADMVQLTLRGSNMRVSLADCVDGGWAILQDEDIDAVLTDLHLGSGRGVELAKRLSEAGRETPVVVMTAFGSMDTAIAALRAGAWDFLTKPVELDEVVHVMRRAVKHSQLSSEVRRLRRAVNHDSACNGMVGSSPAMAALYDLIRRIASRPVNILVTGESGTGKELVARALHCLSDRAEGPFVAVNCAAMPESLLESELFGHRRGAFTGAHESHDGLFVQADGGTIFLDEIGEMSPAVQAKLLRVLQERTVRPVGATQETTFDARLVCATNRDLAEDVKAGRLREDLYYRIKVVHLHAPALRDRGGDILVLAQHFIEKFAARFNVDISGLSRSAAARLMQHDWPGNVRELENSIERAVALARFDKLGLSDLPDTVRAKDTPTSALHEHDAENLPTMHAVERRYILHVLDVADGNKSAAADLLGLDRKTLYRKLRRYAEDESDSDGDGEI
ncbi:MAG: DNA-binding NtrC family response regulator [Bradymonadia bacterium]|jgi:DNA-binding NtrC family response regulator